MAPKPRFQDGERVLCFHGPLLYEAKTLKLQAKERSVWYLVHYQGWNKSWDEWVPETRILKYNDTNVQKQKELQEGYKHVYPQSNNTKPKGKGKGKRSNSEKESSPAASGEIKGIKPKIVPGTSSTETKDSVKEDSSKKKKPRLDPFVETEEAFANKLEIRIKMPEELKAIILDDWDNITRQKKLFNLPARVTVDHILDDFISQKKAAKNSNATKESAIIEFTNGVKEYFNVMLGSQLLYKFERPQYQQFLNDTNGDKPMSSIYGLVHLLRLFVKLGGILIYTGLEEKGAQVLLGHVHDFLKFLAKNPHVYSPNDYVVTTQEYQKKTVQ
ncbi:mortality factor 4-like protein 1 isoform X2 [Brevipalpus obovatus]|uniref:mortality factor 4-like protein 1 isoform X2 n=1 Tax=Brevipalpus obovatus TaxID=246614 RepID=UPI003D9F6629